MVTSLLICQETRLYLGLGESKTRELIRKEYFGCRIGNRLYSNKLLLCAMNNV
ncbi:MAG: molybdate-binding protein [Lachnoclostridium sp.]|nr:molybdate-binding protein [Lachnoclostridium sp.]